MKTFVILLTLMAFQGQTTAMFEDQAFKLDWRLQHIGAVEDAVLYTASKTKDILVVRTVSNVLAALDGDSGRIQWRQIFPESEVLLDLSLEGRQVTSLSYDSAENATFVRLWNVQNGALSKERRIHSPMLIQGLPSDPPTIADIKKGFMFDGTPHLIHKTKDNALKIFAIFDNEEKILHSYTTGAIGDEHGFSCTVLTDTLACVSADQGTVHSTELPFKKVGMGIVPLAALGVEAPVKEGIPIRRIAGNKAQVMLESGEITILTFKAGNFAGVNTMSSKATKGAVLNVAGCSEKEADFVALEQQCDNFQNCAKTVSLLKGTHQDTYEVTRDRGVTTGVWVFCDRDDPDAYQLILRGQDGSLVSLTPLGNVMWQREEGLASIDEVKLVTRDMSDEYDGTYELSGDSTKAETSSEHVLEMFLKPLRHHASQLHMFLEKIKIGKVGLSTLLLGHPDASFDEFDMRKVIVVYTKHGSLYGLDSKSGRVLWQTMTGCDSQISTGNGNNFLFLQRGGAHFGLEPVAALVCSMKSDKAKVVKFNPMNGKLHPTSRIVNNRVLRAILLHHSSNEDHIRPILILTDGSQGFELEPKDAVIKGLTSVSGKMFIANIDADRMGIHGHRLVINEDNSIEKVPIWSFSSAGAKIIHMEAKPTEEVVHSQGRVMADRSVLFKYINPNLAFVLAEGQDSSGKGFVNIYLLDLVTGRIIFSANHRRVQGPYHVVHSENWVVYTYYNEKSRRAELGSLELFEGKTQSNATVFSSLHNTVSPLVERQSYILGPAFVTALKDTVTEKGITTKNLLMATASGAVYNIPRQFLDPRRPSVTTPPEMREPGLPPYVPELVFPPEVILNYNQTLTRVQGIVTAATGLESTSIVFVYGLDLFCSRVNPSKGFDLLKDDFDYFVIASVLVGLTAAAYITRKLSQRKMLKSAWK